MKQAVTTPEEVLKQHVSNVLAQVLPLRDTLHTLPFHNVWLESPLGIAYQSLLQQMEDCLLQCWQTLNSQKSGALQHLNLQVLQWWNSQQKRSPHSIQQQYYALHEFLVDWSLQPLPASLGLQPQWKDYLIFVLTQEKHLLARLCNSSSSQNSLSPSCPSQETQLLAAHYLQQMQHIADSAPHALCSDFFALLSVFTQESIFLPTLTHSSRNSPCSSSHQNLQQFYAQLQKSKHWKKHVSEYCAVLKRNE